MPVKLDWENAEKTLLLAVYDGAWTWDDYYDVTNRMIAHMKTVSNTVDVVVDYRKSAGYPAGNVLSHVRTGAKLLSSAPNYGAFVMITANPFLRIISTTYRKLRLQPGVKDQTFMVGSLDEAKAVLREVRGSSKTG